MENINLQGDYKLEARVENRDSKKGIIIAHSFRNSMDELACSDAEQLFYKNDFTTLSFNFLGHIQRNFLLRKKLYTKLILVILSPIQRQCLKID